MGTGSLPIVGAEQLAANWRSEAPLVCIGAHSHLDGAAASAVAMLAETHGVPARVEPPSALTAANLAALDLSRAALVCLSYFDLKSPARAQYAARRIKGKAPHAKLVLGLWTAADGSILETMKTELNADYAVKDFHTAAAIILKEATTERPLQPEGARAETASAAAESSMSFSRPLAVNAKARSAPAPG